MQRVVNEIEIFPADSVQIDNFLRKWSVPAWRILQNAIGIRVKFQPRPLTEQMLNVTASKESPPEASVPVVDDGTPEIATGILTLDPAVPPGFEVGGLKNTFHLGVIHVAVE